jgi:hypothetical protein
LAVSKLLPKTNAAVRMLFLIILQSKWVLHPAYPPSDFSFEQSTLESTQKGTLGHLLKQCFE